MTVNHSENIEVLLAKSLAGEATATESAILQEWLSGSPENEKFYQQFRQIWDNSQSVLPDIKLDEENAWARFQEKTRRQSNTRRVLPGLYFRAAAIALFVAGLGIALYLLRSGQEIKSKVLTSREETIHETLSDGSDVYLNRHSTMKVESDFGTGSARKLSLEGEAFFKVVKDPSRPFVISVSGLEIQVLGTSFNVNSAGNKTEVIVKTGKVEVKRAGKRAILLPGDVVSIDKDSDIWNKSRRNDDLYQYYIDKKLVSQNLPLLRVVNVLAEYYDTKITITPARINEKINTTLDLKQTLRFNLDVINKTMGTHDEIKDGNIVIR